MHAYEQIPEFLNISHGLLLYAGLLRFINKRLHMCGL